MRLVAVIALCVVAACARTPDPASAPSATDAAANSLTRAALTMDQADIFPTDSSLKRAEDGVILDDGRVVVADQTHGLRVVNPDGSSAPYGNFAEAGYAHSAEAPAGPNGVAFTPDRAHILVADIYSGAIWRVAVADESAEKIYQHAYGVNSAIEDLTGAIWFTQSTENEPGPGSEARMFAAIDRAMKDGKLFRLVGDEATVMMDGLAFANGVAFDAERSRLYFAETMGDRLWAAGLEMDRPDVLRDLRVFSRVIAPDNVKIGRDGVVYLALPVLSELAAFNPETGDAETYFSAATTANKEIAAEWRRRVEKGEGAIDLFTPIVWGAMPGAITSVILTTEGDPAYLGNLGDALVRLRPAAE